MAYPEEVMEERLAKIVTEVERAAKMTRDGDSAVAHKRGGGRWHTRDGRGRGEPLTEHRASCNPR